MSERQLIERLVGALQAIAMNPQLPGTMLAGIAKNILDDPAVAPFKSEG